MSPPAVQFDRAGRCVAANESADNAAIFSGEWVSCPASEMRAYPALVLDRGKVRAMTPEEKAAAAEKAAAEIQQSKPDALKLAENDYIARAGAVDMEDRLARVESAIRIIAAGGTLDGVPSKPHVLTVEEVRTR